MTRSDLAYPGTTLLLRTEPEDNIRRFYAISVEADLFGGARLVRAWGRQGTLGRMMATHHPDRHSATQAKAEMTARKLRRGYQAAAQG